MDFEKEMNEKDIVGGELTPMINTKRPQMKGLRSGNTQYFTNIDGKYVKDAEARAELADVEEYVYGALEPWQPLEDGYSNFWFELTNDTLSPWLNFSAKNNDAVIDWGDGSGEQALTTLTPTHTYSKAGKYIVKVKGVLGISRQHNPPYNGAYLSVLRNVELNNTFTTINGYGFMYCVCLENVKLPSSITSIGNYSFYATSVKKLQFPNGITSAAFNVAQFCFELGDISLPNSMTAINGSAFQSCASLTSITLPNALLELGNNAFQSCLSISEITIPSTVTSIGSYIFQTCSSLAEIHIQATVPPTLSVSNHFQGLPVDYIIYVPVGYGDTYKAASGWSTYADHILEEGQTPNRAMLAKFNSAKTDEPQDDMR